MLKTDGSKKEKEGRERPAGEEKYIEKVTLHHQELLLPHQTEMPINYLIQVR
jgi:hypothetical protein